MSLERSIPNVGGFAGFVNGLAILATISLIGAGYISAIGAFAGVA